MNIPLASQTMPSTITPENKINASAMSAVINEMAAYFNIVFLNRYKTELILNLVHLNNFA